MSDEPNLFSVNIILNKDDEPVSLGANRITLAHDGILIVKDGNSEHAFVAGTWKSYEVLVIVDRSRTDPPVA